MATIVQTVPKSDSVLSSDSDTYVNQLVAAGATAPIIWTTTVSSSGLIVTPSGNIAAVGTLPVGPYLVSGTMVDAASNTGVWSFTLTVRNIFTPQVTVTPSQPAAPTGIEIMVPFQIDPATGGVAYVTDYNRIIAQHLLTIVMTANGERVMNPTYGFGLEEKTFSPMYAQLPSLIGPDLQAAISEWEPDVQISAVNVEQDSNNPAVLNITISYSVLPSNTVSTAVLAVGGGINQVVSS